MFEITSLLHGWVGYSTAKRVGFKPPFAWIGFRWRVFRFIWYPQPYQNPTNENSSFFDIDTYIDSGTLPMILES